MSSSSSSSSSNSNCSSNDLHRSHSSSKKSSHSDRTDRSDRSDRHSENRKSSSNHSSSIEKQKLPMEIPLKKGESSSNAPPSRITKSNEETDLKDDDQLASPIQVSSSHSNIAPLTSSAPESIPAPPIPTAVAHPLGAIHTMPCDSDNHLQLPIQPPLPTTVPPVSPPPPPPPPPPPLEDDENQSRSSTMPDSSTQQPPAPPPTKVRKLNSGDKNATDKNSDILGSIMASMDSPRNSSNF